MTLCGDGCVPCCDYCIYAIHDLWTDDMGVVYDQRACGCKKSTSILSIKKLLMRADIARIFTALE